MVRAIYSNFAKCFLNTGNIIDSLDDAPIGICFANDASINTPYSFWSTVITFVGNNSNYAQQFVIPWAKGESTAIKYRIKDNGTWSDWISIKEHSIVYKTITLTYKSDSEMYAEIDAIGIPISFQIYEVSQTPYTNVTHTSITQIGDKVMCSAYGSFVSGHVLSASVKFY